MSNAIVDFKCKPSITQYFRCHKSTFWFRHCTSTTISSSVLYGIWADSAATIHYGFSDNGYVGISTDGANDIVIYEGYEGRKFFDSSFMLVELTGSQTISPRPNFIYRMTNNVRLTILPPPQEGSLVASNMSFYIYFNLGCGMTSYIDIPDPTGTTVGLTFMPSAYYGCKGLQEITQFGAGYTYPTIFLG